MQLDAILKAVDGIRPILLEEAPKCELERRVTQRAVDTLRDCGLFKLLAPKRFGGFEMHPTECLQIWEALARID